MERISSCYDILAFTFLLMMNYQWLSFATDESALLSLKAHITSDPLGIVTRNWTNSSSVCTWIGVTCRPPHRGVVSVNISDMELAGTIPPELGNMSFLVSLDLRYNSFSGEIPREIGMLESLQFLYLRDNELAGNLPREIGNLTNLKRLVLTYNHFTGALPREIGKLHKLEEFVTANNSFMGFIPSELFNISTLRILSFVNNGLSGTLPAYLGYKLPNLEQLFLGMNNFSGVIPLSLSNCSNLNTLSLGRNEFTGFVPDYLGSLRQLRRLEFQDNHLRSEPSSSELSFITSLTNCRSLSYFSIDMNPIAGAIPASVGNLSSSLKYIYASDCEITGTIPAEIGNLSNLVSFSLGKNRLSGNIPIAIKNLHSFQALGLSINNLRGPIPEGLCELSSLNLVYLIRNQFSGPIPGCLGNVSSLRHILLRSNMLSSSIPTSLWRLKDLLRLDLSNNSLSGSLPPEIGNLVAAIYVNLSVNYMSGNIPTTLGGLLNLADFSLAHNGLKGSIPASIGSMINLVTLDLSYNSLSGPIPKALETLQHLDYFNVSFNGLNGEIPTGGPFGNFTGDSFKGNPALCGIQRFNVSLCHTVFKRKSRGNKARLALIILSGVFAFTLVASVPFIFIRYRRKRQANSSGTVASMPTAPERISYYRLLDATEQFSEDNLLGIGSFGSVYKGTFGPGKTLAVKVFNLQSQAAFRSFEVECEVLRSIRHRNLTKVVSSCANEHFKALVLEYMPNGSLEKWLHSDNYFLDIMQRLNIMIDVASALEYLHHGCSSPIIHCDLKPSNVLLDEDMAAHVSDFGIAKVLGEGESVSHTYTLATLGYIAPEYGLEGIISIRCDVYSFGVLLMETFTRKRPSDDMFAGDLSLKSWIESSLPDSSAHVVDDSLLNTEDEGCDKNLKCVSSVLNLALKCSTESPANRMKMKEAVVQLRKIRHECSNE